MNTAIENKDGTISPYGFMCGYQEIYGDWLNYKGVRLFADGCYHVRGIVRDPEDGLKTFVWETFENIAEARRFARKFGALNTG